MFFSMYINMSQLVLTRQRVVAPRSGRACPTGIRISSARSGGGGCLPLDRLRADPDVSPRGNAPAPRPPPPSLSEPHTYPLYPPTQHLPTPHLSEASPPKRQARSRPHQPGATCLALPGTVSRNRPALPRSPLPLPPHREERRIMIPFFSRNKHMLPPPFFFFFSYTGSRFPLASCNVVYPRFFLPQAILLRARSFSPKE